MRYDFPPLLAPNSNEGPHSFPHFKLSNILHESGKIINLDRRTLIYLDTFPFSLLNLIPTTYRLDDVWEMRCDIKLEYQGAGGFYVDLGRTNSLYGIVASKVKLKKNL